MKTMLQLLATLCFPFILSSQIWKYPASAYQYHHDIYLNHDMGNKKGIRSMTVKVFIGNDTLHAYSKYDPDGRVIEYKSEYDTDTAFYFYDKGEWWTSVKSGSAGQVTARQIEFQNDTISSIETNFLRGKDISKFSYDSRNNLIKAIHNDSITEEFIYANDKLKIYFKSVKGAIQKKMIFNHSGDTVFYADYSFIKNEEKLLEETYGVFKDKKLILINTQTDYGGNNPSVWRHRFKYNKQGKIIEYREENSFDGHKLKEIFTYDKRGNLKKRELISKNEKPRILCQYFYVYY